MDAERRTQRPALRASRPSPRGDAVPAARISGSDLVSGAAGLRERAWAAAARVVDPEIPVLSIADLGVLRDVRVAGDTVEVVITPTYSGCPAMRMIELEIEAALRAAGLDNRLAERRRPAQARRIRHRTAPGRRVAPRPLRRRRRGLPALRLGRDRAPRRIRLDLVQGALPLPQLRRALRLFQMPLAMRARLTPHPAP